MTVCLCDLHIERRSRTRDQMVQAARSGVQNIAEGSQVSGTSKKFEMKLTNVARANLEELRLDHEDFLRQRRLPLLPHDHPALMRFKRRRCATLQEVQAWVAEERRRAKMDKHGRAQTDTDEESVRASPCESIPSSALAANAALSLLNLVCHLLNRQMAAQAKSFEEEGGFTERLHRVRSRRRKPSA